MVIELFDEKGKKLAAILNFDRNYSPNPIFSEQIFYHFIFILRPFRKIYLWLVPNFVYMHLFNSRTIAEYAILFSFLAVENTPEKT